MKTRVGDEIGVMRKGSIFGEAAADGVVSVFFIPPLVFFRGAYLAFYSRLPLFIVTSFRPAGFLLSSCFVSARDQRLGPLPEFDGHGMGRSSRLRVAGLRPPLPCQVQVGTEKLRLLLLPHLAMKQVQLLVSSLFAERLSRMP